MAYDTMNPVPSTDPRDLYDNAGVVDKYTNGEQPFVPDRLGKQRRTWKGMEVDFNNAQEGRGAQFDADQLSRNAQFAAALASIGLTWIGDYGAGLTFTTRQQYTVRGGLAYVVANDTTIPYTATGNWTTEASKFKLVNSDQVLRSDLALTSGAGLVGFDVEVSYPENTIGAQLKAATAAMERVPLLSLMPAAEREAMRNNTTTYDASADLLAAFNEAAERQVLLTFDVGTILFREAIIPATMPGIIGGGKGTFKTNTTSSGTGLGVLIVQGSFYGPTYTGLDRAIFMGFNIDCGGGAKRGFFGSSVTNCYFERVNVSNMTGTGNTAGIRLIWDCSDNDIYNCTIRMPVMSGEAYECYGIQINGNSVDGFGGYGTGNFVATQNICYRNTVRNCKTFNGSHGISINASEWVFVFGNNVNNPAHRALHFSPQVRYGLVADNNLQEFGSSAIIFGYNCSYIKVSNNRCFSTFSGGEGVIQAYVGCQHITFNGNTLRGAGNFGFYTAIDSVYIRFNGNDIDATANKKAAMAIESEWAAGQVAPFLYARPNYGAPPGTRTAWANGNCLHNTFANNTITAGNGTIAVLYVAQVGALAGVDLTYINGNDFESSAFANTFYFVETQSGKLSRAVCNNNNSSLQEIGKAYATRGRAHFNSVRGNDTFNGDAWYAAPVNTALPSAFYSDKISIANYTAATNVTQFIGGKEGQRVTVRLGPNVTLVHNAAMLSLKSGNIAATSTTQFMDFLQTGGVWFEQSRNF